MPKEPSRYTYRVAVPAEILVDVEVKGRRSAGNETRAIKAAEALLKENVDPDFGFSLNEHPDCTLPEDAMGRVYPVIGSAESETDLRSPAVVYVQRSQQLRSVISTAVPPALRGDKDPDRGRQR